MDIYQYNALFFSIKQLQIVQIVALRTCLHI